MYQYPVSIQNALGVLEDLGLGHVQSQVIQQYNSLQKVKVQPLKELQEDLKGQVGSYKSNISQNVNTPTTAVSCPTDSENINSSLQYAGHKIRSTSTGILETQIGQRKKQKEAFGGSIQIMLCRVCLKTYHNLKQAHKLLFKSVKVKKFSGRKASNDSLLFIPKRLKEKVENGSLSPRLQERQLNNYIEDQSAFKQKGVFEPSQGLPEKIYKTKADEVRQAYQDMVNPLHSSSELSIKRIEVPYAYLYGVDNVNKPYNPAYPIRDPFFEDFPMRVQALAQPQLYQQQQQQNTLQASFQQPQSQSHSPADLYKTHYSGFQQAYKFDQQKNLKSPQKSPQKSPKNTANQSPVLKGFLKSPQKSPQNSAKEKKELTPIQQLLELEKNKGPKQKAEQVTSLDKDEDDWGPQDIVMLPPVSESNYSDKYQQNDNNYASNDYPNESLMHQVSFSNNNNLSLGNNNVVTLSNDTGNAQKGLNRVQSLGATLREQGKQGQSSNKLNLDLSKLGKAKEGEGKVPVLNLSALDKKNQNSGKQQQQVNSKLKSIAQEVYEDMEMAPESVQKDSLSKKQDRKPQLDRNNRNSIEQMQGTMQDKTIKMNREKQNRKEQQQKDNVDFQVPEADDEVQGIFDKVLSAAAPPKTGAWSTDANKSFVDNYGDYSNPYQNSQENSFNSQQPKKSTQQPKKKNIQSLNNKQAQNIQLQQHQQQQQQQKVQQMDQFPQMFLQSMQQSSNSTQNMNLFDEGTGLKEIKTKDENSNSKQRNYASSEIDNAGFSFPVTPVQNEVQDPPDMILKSWPSFHAQSDEFAYSQKSDLKGSEIEFRTENNSKSSPDIAYKASNNQHQSATVSNNQQQNNQQQKQGASSILPEPELDSHSFPHIESPQYSINWTKWNQQSQGGFENEGFKSNARSKVFKDILEPKRKLETQKNHQDQSQYAQQQQQQQNVLSIQSEPKESNTLSLIQRQYQNMKQQFLNNQKNKSKLDQKQQSFTLGKSQDSKQQKLFKNSQDLSKQQTHQQESSQPHQQLFKSKLSNDDQIARETSENSQQSHEGPIIDLYNQGHYTDTISLNQEYPMYKNTISFTQEYPQAKSKSNNLDANQQQKQVDIKDHQNSLRFPDQSQQQQSNSQLSDTTFQQGLRHQFSDYAFDILNHQSEAQQQQQKEAQKLNSDMYKDSNQVSMNIDSNQQDKQIQQQEQNQQQQHIAQKSKSLENLSPQDVDSRLFDHNKVARLSYDDSSKIINDKIQQQIQQNSEQQQEQNSYNLAQPQFNIQNQLANQTSQQQNLTQGIQDVDRYGSGKIRANMLGYEIDQHIEQNLDQFMADEIYGEGVQKSISMETTPTHAGYKHQDNNNDLNFKHDNLQDLSYFNQREYQEAGGQLFANNNNLGLGMAQPLKSPWNNQWKSSHKGATSQVSYNSKAMSQKNYSPEIESENGHNVRPHSSASERTNTTGFMYYNEEDIERNYEIINLKVFHVKNHTGLEESESMRVYIGDIIAGRYQVTEYLGQAVFSVAVQACDLKTGDFVCLKIIKNIKDYFDQGLDEIKVLRMIKARDSDDSKGILKLLDYLYYKEHLILVTELLQINLFEWQKQFYQKESGTYIRDSYFTLPRLKMIAKQLLQSIQFMHSLGLVHADLKPENIMMKDYTKCQVKIIDLGSSRFVHDYLSQSIPNLLARIESVCGRINQDMIRQSTYAQSFYTRDFILYERINDDPQQVVPAGNNYYNNIQSRDRINLLFTKSTPLASILNSNDQEFVDFITQLLTVQPDLRPTATDALNHRWLKGQQSIDDIQFTHPITNMKATNMSRQSSRKMQFQHSMEI